MLELIEHTEPTICDKIMRVEVVEFERLWEMAGYIPVDLMSSEGMAKSFFLAGCNYRTELTNNIDSTVYLPCPF